MKHKLQLGPQTRRAVRLVARIVNPLVIRIAGRRWMPILGVLQHRGRRSGRTYRTPLGMRRLGDRFIVPRTFGEEAAWYRNISAAGHCTVTYLGRDYTLVAPEVIDYAAARAAFPRYERLQFRLLGIDEFLRLRIASAGIVQPPITLRKEA